MLKIENKFLCQTQNFLRFSRKWFYFLPRLFQRKRYKRLTFHCRPYLWECSDLNFYCRTSFKSSEAKSHNVISVEKNTILIFLGIIEKWGSNVYFISKSTIGAIRPDRYCYCKEKNQFSLMYRSWHFLIRCVPQKFQIMSKNWRLW